MTASTLFAWLSARRLDLHASQKHGEWTLTAIRGDYVKTGTAADVDEAIELLQVAVDGSWRADSRVGEREAG